MNPSVTNQNEPLRVGTHQSGPSFALPTFMFLSHQPPVWPTIPVKDLFFCNNRSEILPK